MVVAETEKLTNLSGYAKYHAQRGLEGTVQLGMGFEDLYQEMMMVGLKAIRSFDSSRGAELETLAWIYMDKRLKHMIEDAQLDKRRLSLTAIKSADLFMGIDVEDCPAQVLDMVAERVDFWEHHHLSQAVRQIVSMLSPLQQAIAQRLMDGEQLGVVSKDIAEAEATIQKLRHPSVALSRLRKRAGRHIGYLIVVMRLRLRPVWLSI